MTALKTPRHYIAATHLRDLLAELARSGTGVAVKLYFDGELCTEHFSQVLMRMDHTIMLAHLPSRTVVNVPDLSTVTGFELDTPFNGFAAGTPYGIHADALHSNVHQDG